MIIRIPFLTLLTSLVFLHPVRLTHFSIYLLIPFICCCTSSYEERVKTGLPADLRAIEIKEADSPNELKLLLLSDSKISPEQFMLRFKSNSRFEGWKYTYPSQMMHSIAYFPLNSGREHTMELFTLWVKESYDESASFIEEKLVDSSLRDSAIEGMVNGLKSDQLSVAVSWAHELSEQGKRHQLLESLATH